GDLPVGDSVRKGVASRVVDERSIGKSSAGSQLKVTVWRVAEQRNDQKISVAVGVVRQHAIGDGSNEWHSAGARKKAVVISDRGVIAQRRDTERHGGGVAGKLRIV